MANMSYCRFRNTLKDLKDCYQALFDGEELDEEEEKAKVLLVKLCKTIAEEV